MASPPVAQVLLSERWRSHDWAEGGADKEETLEEVDAKLDQCASHSIACAQHELEAHQQRGKPPAREQAPLLGRVVRKRALWFWGGLQERAAQACPFEGSIASRWSLPHLSCGAQSFATSFVLELQDATGKIQVTVWNRRCWTPLTRPPTLAHARAHTLYGTDARFYIARSVWAMLPSSGIIG